MLNLTPFNSQPHGDPIARIVATLVAYAIKDAAREIHIQPLPESRGASIFYRLRDGEDPQEQLKVPFYVLKPLRDHLEKMADEDGSFEVDLVSEKHQISLSYVLEMSVQSARDGETIVLKLDGKFNPPSQ